MLIVSLAPGRIAEGAAIAARLAVLAPDLETVHDGARIVASRRGAAHAGDLRVWFDGAALVDRRKRANVEGDELAARLQRDGIAALPDLAPPFRFAWAKGDTTTVVADWPGLAHIFLWSRDGIAVAGTSATLIAQVFGLGVDTGALAGLALTGSMLGIDTPVAGIRKLAAGRFARFTAGRFELATLPPPSRLADAEDAVASAVASRAESFADAEVEVSGGFDSRMIVAALPRDGRAGTLGVTIGTDASPDVVTARRICAMTGMEALVIDPQLDDLDGDGLDDLLRTAAHCDNYGSNPVDRAAINRLNTSRSSGARFTGQNGEILRGFYYPGQRLGAAPSPALARELIAWRIFSNDVVDSELFDGAWYTAQKARAAGQVETMLLDGEGDWSQRLDAYYLDQRMQRWCGAAVSAAMDKRALLMPFFDADVLGLAQSLPGRAKRESRYAAGLIARLDPRLAELPTDSGIVAATVARGGLRAWGGHMQRTAGKFVAKARQKLVRRDRATFGSARTVQRVYELGLHRRVDLHRLDQLKIFAPARLEAFGRGTWRPGRSTLGYILNTHYLLDRVA